MRVRLDIPKDRAEEIKALMKKASISTEKEFFNAALSLFRWAIEEKEAGRMIGSLEEKIDGVEFQRLVFSSLEWNQDRQDNSP